jgi:superfamily II RNA helicase
MQTFIETFQNLYPYSFYKEQNEGIEAMYQNKNLLACLPTGSGKSLFAEFAIQLAHAKRKKVIYASPIKALSNQKFNEFTNKFPLLSIGIMTGDIKFNPDAQVIILTTEILRNLLYKKKNNSDILEDEKLEISININEIGYVVFDEVHYINDLDRGRIWEESFILLPKHIKLCMLSATLGNPLDFANWVQNVSKREVHTVMKKDRLIPLKHFVFYNMKYPGKKLEKFIEKDEFKKLYKNANNLVEIVNEDNDFNTTKYNEMNSLAELNRKMCKYINPKSTFNQLLKILKNKGLLPCIFFVFSRKKCEQYAFETDMCFNTKEEQSEVEKIINKELRKLNNYHVYLNSRQLIDMKKILTKGVAYHHSGLMPVLKEIIEILYSKKLIKVLFATETFAIGVNMPSNSVIFTDIKKYSNNGMRFLHTHEYAQIAGRSSRPGLNNKNNNFGTVILLQNLFDLPESQKMKSIMTGKSQVIQSKFSLNYQFITNVVLSENNNIETFINQTLIKDEVNNHIKNLSTDIQYKETKYEQSLFDEYYNLTHTTNQLTKKEKKVRNKRKNEIEKLDDFKTEYEKYLYNYELEQTTNQNKENIEYYSSFIEKDVHKLLSFLNKMKYINYTGQKFSEISQKNLSIKGIACSTIHEVNELLLTELFFNNIFDDLTSNELIAVLALFCDSKNLTDEYRHSNAENLQISDKLYYRIKKIEDITNKLSRFEESHNIQITEENRWRLNYDFVEYAWLWPHTETFYELGFDNFIGNFIKDMIKIDNVCKEIETLAKLTNKVQLLNNLKNITQIIMKDVVDIQSLYIIKK